VVSIGTIVRLTDLSNIIRKHSRSSGLGFGAEKGVISYLSPVAQAILNHRSGEEVEFDLEGSHKRWRIDSIELIKRL